MTPEDLPRGYSERPLSQIRALDAKRIHLGSQRIFSRGYLSDPYRRFASWVPRGSTWAPRGSAPEAILSDPYRRFASWVPRGSTPEAIHVSPVCRSHTCRLTFSIAIIRSHCLLQTVPDRTRTPLGHSGLADTVEQHFP